MTDATLGDLLQLNYVYCVYFWPARSGVAAGSHALVIYGVQKGTMFIMDPAPTRGIVREPISFFHRPGINVALGVSWLSELGRSLDRSIATVR